MAEHGKTNDTISRLAFAIQDERMTRRRAQQITRTVLGFLTPGDYIGRGLVVEEERLVSVQPVVAQLAAE